MTHLAVPPIIYQRRQRALTTQPGQRYTRGVRDRTPRYTLLLACALACAAPRPGLAQQAAPAPSLGSDWEADTRVDVAIDSAITAGLLAGTLLISLVPVDTDGLWDRQLFGPLDDRVKDEFSSSAAKMADGLLVVTSVAPVLLQVPRGLNEDTGRRLLLYSEAVSASLFLNGLAKYLVQRPRPYNYHPDQRVRDYAEAEGDDSHLSFYSGHASTAFAAAVAGSYLFSLAPTDDRAKAAVWLFQLTLATATSGLRVRAGKHFYSDVVIGAVAGSATGLLVPALHAGEHGLRMPSGLEWGAMAGGVVLGGLVSWLLPLDRDVLTPLDAASALEIPTMAPVGAPTLWFTGQL
jgi:membrane-associated phospholipid phosphatase